MIGRLLLCCALLFATWSYAALPPGATISISSTANVCQNSSGPVITFTGSTGTAPYTFTYTINAGAPQTVTTTSGNSVNITGNTATPGTRTYTLVSVQDDTNTTVPVSGNVSFTVLARPDATMGGNGAGSTFDGLPVFRQCINTASTFTFSNTSTTSSTNATYTIDWGDGSPNFTGSDWSTLTHNYNVGIYTLTYSITGNNGCYTTREYIVFIGLNPAVALGNPGNTDICSNQTLTFPITGTANNPEGTIYTVTFNDGSTAQEFDHPPPATVTHTFLNSSCGTTSSDGTNSYPHSFSATIVASNPCSTSSVGVVPIYVSSTPQADFEMPSGACVNTQVCFSSDSSGNEIMSGNCTAPKMIWQIAPNTGFTVSSGSTLGNDFGSADVGLWMSGSEDLCVNFTTPGTYTVTLKIANKCGVATKVKTICISAPLVPQFTLNNTSGCAPMAVSATNTTNTAASCTAGTQVWSVVHTPDFCSSGAVTIANQNTSNASYNFTEAGIYTITLTTQNSCGTTQTSQTVVVKKPPTVSLNPIADRCGPGNITPQASVNPCAPSSEVLNYAWSFPGGTPASSTAANPGPIAYTAPGDYTISLAVSSSCGNSTTATQTFTVHPVPALTNTDLLQTICSGTSSAPILLTADVPGTSFSWTASASAGVTGFQPNGTTAQIPAQPLIYTGSATGTVTYTVTPTANGCTGPATIFQIQVTPAPVILAQPQPQTVCLNASSAPLEMNVNAGAATATYQWFVNTANHTTGATAIPGATSSAYTPPANATGILYYFAVVSLTSGGCATLNSQIAAVTVVPQPEFNVQPIASQQVCTGGSIPALTASVTGGTGSVTYQWFSNTSDSNSGGTPIAGATSDTYAPVAFTAIGDYYFYVTATFSGNGCDAVSSSVASVNVIADPEVTSEPLSVQTLCLGTAPQTLEVEVSGGSGALSYQWFSNTTDSNTGGAPIPSATSATYIPPTNAVGTTYYYVVATQPVPGCSVTSQTAQITINPSPSVTIQPVPAQICVGGTTAPLSISVANGVGTASYQWFSNTSDNTASGTPVPGATLSTYTPDTGSIGSLWYYASITFSGIEGSCQTITTDPALIEVISGAEIQLASDPLQTVCVGASLEQPLSLTYTGGVGTPSYQWYSNAVNSTSGGTPVGTNAPDYTPPPFSTPGDYYYYVILTLSGSGCGSVISDIVQISVLPDPVVTTQPMALQTLCQGTTPEPLSVSVSGGAGGFNYQWYSNTTNSNSGGTMIPGADEALFTPLIPGAGTFYYYCVINQPMAGCDVTSDVAQIVVNTSPSVVVQPQAAQACQHGVVPDLTFTTANGVGTETFQWFTNTADNNTTGTAISGATEATFTPPTTAIGTVWYYAEITFSGISGDCATIATAATPVEITGNAVITGQPHPLQTVCSGGVIEPLQVNYSGGTGTPTFQWHLNTDNSTTGGTPVGSDAPFYTPDPINVPGTYYYYVTVQLSGNGCTPVASEVASVVVVPDPEISVQPIAAQTLCPGEAPIPLAVTVTGGVGSDYDYQWFVSMTPDTNTGTAVAGETNMSFVPPTNSTGTLYYYVEISQSTGSGCQITSALASVTVPAAPFITSQPTGQTACGGQPLDLLTFGVSNGVGDPQYQWFVNTADSNTSGTPIPGANLATYLPENTETGTLYYYAVIAYPELTGSCASVATDPAAISISQNPVISDKTATICSAAAFNISPETSGSDIVPTGTTYIWGEPVIVPAGAITGASAADVPQPLIGQALVNLLSVPATATYTVTPTSGDCTGLPFSIIVTVNPAINPNVVVHDNLCFGADNAQIVTNVTGGIPFPSGDPYLYSWTGPEGFTSSDAVISNLAPGHYTLMIEDAGGCPFAQTYTISEPSQMLVQQTQVQQVSCHGASDATISVDVTGGTPGYTFQWLKNGETFSDMQHLSGLSPGVYEVTIADANLCGPIHLSFSIVEPEPLTATVTSQINVACFGDNTGSIVISASGGTPLELSPGDFGYSYVWSGPNGYSSAVQNPENLYAGLYILTVTDANGCAFSLEVTVTESPELLIQYTTTEITCYGANDASFSVTLSGGVAPYSFVWDNFSTLLNQTNLSAGTYTITVTDALGCQKTHAITIPEAPLFAVDPIVTQISCHGAQDGSIQLNFVGGIAPVTLVWSDGSPAGTTRNGLSAGTYTVAITDGKPCEIIRTFVIVEPAPLTLSGVVADAAECNSGTTGAIDLTASGGTPPYTYEWSNGSSSEDLSGLTNGNYAVTVTDARGCVAQTQFQVMRPEPLSISITDHTTFDCETRTVVRRYEANISGGVSPYAIHWSGGNVSGTNNQFMQTSDEGLMNVTATDDRGCEVTMSFQVDIPQLGNAGFEPTSTGSTFYGIFAIEDPITFTSTLTGDYQTLIWDFGDGTFSNELHPVHTYVNPGAYIVHQTVTYPFGCQYTHTITLLVEEGYFLTIPTAFTPNRDGINDTYRPVSKRLESLRIEIYDSWGSMVYSEEGDVLAGWDGTIRGLGAENGNYYCTVTGRTFYGKTIIERRTFVLVK